MCMAVPMKLIEKNGDEGRCDVNGVIRETRLDMVPEAVPGDFLLVHAGFAIEIVSPEEAQKTLELFDELTEFQSTLDAEEQTGS